MRVLIFAFVLAVAGSEAAQSSPSIERLYPLRPQEQIYAYARISPSGNFLAYAAELPADQVAEDPQRIETVIGRDGTPRQVLINTEILTVVDLRTRRTLFQSPGVDGYWSNDERRLIFLNLYKRPYHVSLWDRESGEVEERVAPEELGAYFSWGKRDGRDLILTILSQYYYLGPQGAVLPPQLVAECPGIGRGERPLLSKDGRRITTFVRGSIVVRNLTDCEDILDTGVQGAKADFSFDGRYIAFHAPKPRAEDGYEIRVIDTQARTMRTVTNLPGSSLFPSWTRDGRLCFRYEGKDYAGFMMASQVLTAPQKPLPSPVAVLPEQLTWEDLFPQAPAPPHALKLVLIWATWNAYSPRALVDLQQAEEKLRAHGVDVVALTSTELSSAPADVKRQLAKNGITLPYVMLAPERLGMTEALNQIPATLLFRGDHLIDRRLGAQSTAQLYDWVSSRR